MHPFTELSARVAGITLGALRDTEQRMLEILQTSGATPPVKNLQAVRLGKAMLAVGLLSTFEARLQDALQCTDGFVKADEVLELAGRLDLKEEFALYRRAINVLKHGEGSSYDYLVENKDKLPFRIKLPEESFFSEGDVSEVSVLVDADEKFVERCAEIIQEVASVIERQCSGVWV